MCLPPQGDPALCSACAVVGRPSDLSVLNSHLNLLPQGDPALCAVCVAAGPPGG
jgi:hypothetical protein